MKQYYSNVTKSYNIMYIGPAVETDYGMMGCGTMGCGAMGCGAMGCGMMGYGVLDCCREILRLDLAVALQLIVEESLYY